MNTKTKLYKDIIEAGAIGDAFGYFVEFDPTSIIDYKYNNFCWDEALEKFPKWRISDDTQMTLFALERIIPYMHNKELPFRSLTTDIYIGFGDWYNTQTINVPKKPELKKELADFEQLYKMEAPGGTCMSALNSFQMGTLNHPINDSKGCGGIMRTAPVAFIEELSLDAAFEFGAKQAAITHGHPDGYLSAGFFTALLKAHIDDNLSVLMDPTVGVFNLLFDITKRYPKHEAFVKYVEKVIYYINQPERLEKKELNNVLGQGWVGDEALGIAMYCAYKNDNFKDCLVHASYHDGDSDSTASLAAQLFVAKGGKMGDCIEVLDRMPAYPAIEFLFDKF
jgi:ADP-ribosylglycohydrolase